MVQGGAAGLPPLFAETLLGLPRTPNSRPVLPRITPPSPRPIKAFFPKQWFKVKGGKASGTRHALTFDLCFRDKSLVWARTQRRVFLILCFPLRSQTLRRKSVDAENYSVLE